MGWSLREILSIPKGKARRNYAFKFRPFGEKYRAERFNIKKGVIEESVTINNVSPSDIKKYRQKEKEQLNFLKKYNII
jgi:hypothetical protein